MGNRVATADRTDHGMLGMQSLWPLRMNSDARSRTCRRQVGLVRIMQSKLVQRVQWAGHNVDRDRQDKSGHVAV